MVEPAPPALRGLKVVELAQLVSGPMAGSLLADLGAEVVHVEDPRLGDALRRTRAAKDGTHLWWKVAGRNKRSVTLDLRVERGQDLARSLIRWADVLITNMRPSTLAGWGLDWARAQAENPVLIMLHVTGFGLGTSRQDEPGFGKVGEAMSGVVHLTGFPDGPPVHTGFSHADTLAGVMGTVGIQAALYRRSVDPDFAGELVDLALFEPLFRLIEWQVIETDQLGVTPGRAGNRLDGSAGSVVDLFPTADGGWVTVSAGTPRSVQILVGLLGDPGPDGDLGERTRRWVAGRTTDEAVAGLRDAGVVASKIYDAGDILADPLYRERGDIIEVPDADLGPLRMPGVIPHLSNYPGTVWRGAPALGQDNELVYGTYLGLSGPDLDGLARDGVV